jgi:hypothetical protein
LLQQGQGNQQIEYQHEHGERDARYGDPQQCHWSIGFRLNLSRLNLSGVNPQITLSRGWIFRHKMITFSLR